MSLLSKVLPINGSFLMTPGLPVIRAGTTIFMVGGNLQIYEYGKIRAVNFQRNPETPSCEENKACTERLPFSTEIFEQRILPRFDAEHEGPLQVDFKTERDGSFSISEPVELPSPFPEIHLDDCNGLPHIPLSAICRESRMGSLMDIVTIRDDTVTLLVYKHSGVFPWEKVPKMRYEEATVLSQFDSPFIIRPSYIVVRSTADGSAEMYGFLMPYYPRGTIHGFVKNGRAASLPDRLKIRWAFQLASGVSLLHSQGVYAGDLKLTNTLVTEDDNICLIEIAPDGYTEAYLAPECTPSAATMWKTKQSAQRDVWALGVMLWLLWEGHEEEAVRHSTDVITRQWQSAPAWYRDIVDKCLDLDALKRPSSAVVASVLEPYATPIACI